MLNNLCNRLDDVNALLIDLINSANYEDRLEDILLSSKQLNSLIKDYHERTSSY